MSPPVEQNASSSIMSIHELDTNPTPPPSTLLLADFLNSTINDDNKNVIVRIGLNENQVINLQYCQNGEITPYIENFHPGNRPRPHHHPQPVAVEEVEDNNVNISTENDDDRTIEDEDDENESTESRVQATQEEIDLRESAVYQEENEANQFELELTNREQMLRISLCAREVLIVRREYEATRRQRFLKLREKFILEHEENDNQTSPEQVQDIRGLG